MRSEIKYEEMQIAPRYKEPDSRFRNSKRSGNGEAAKASFGVEAVKSI